MIFLYIFLGIAVFLALVLFTDIRIKIEFKEKLNIRFYFGIIKIPESVLKSASKKDKKKSSKADSNSENYQKKKKKSNKTIEKIQDKGYYESFIALMDFLKPVITILSEFASKIVIKPLIVKIKMVGNDAAKLAVDYGKFCFVYYPAVNLLSSKTNCKKIDSDVYVDYTDKKSEFYIYTEIKIKLIYCLKSAISVLIEFLRLKNKFE